MSSHAMSMRKSERLGSVDGQARRLLGACPGAIGTVFALFTGFVEEREGEKGVVNKSPSPTSTFQQVLKISQILSILQQYCQWQT